MGDVDVLKEFRFPLHIAVAAHGHGRFRAGDDLGNSFVLVDDFMHPRLYHFDVVKGDRMADFQLAVQGFAQSMLDQYLAIGVEIADSADQEQDGRPYQALVAFHRIDRQPVDIAALIYFLLRPTHSLL